MYHIHGTLADKVLRAWYQPLQRCLLLGSADGEAGFTRLVSQKIAAVAWRYAYLTPFQDVPLGKILLHDPYMREDLMDFGILIDTLECAVTWQQVPEVHARVREIVKSRPHTICMTHLSHAYPQGTNLYFIFIARIQDIDEYLTLQYGVLEAIRKSGAAMSHHHGIGNRLTLAGGQIGVNDGCHSCETALPRAILTLAARRIRHDPRPSKNAGAEADPGKGIYFFIPTTTVSYALKIFSLLITAPRVSMPCYSIRANLLAKSASLSTVFHRA
jgi:hypothetical protein